MSLFTFYESLCCQRRSYFNFNNDLSQNENKNEPNDSTIHNSNENAIDAGEESDSSTSSFSCPFVQNISELNQSCDWNKEALQKCNYDTDLVDFSLQSQLQLPVTREVDDSCIEIVLPPTFTNSTCTNQVNEATLSSTNCEVNKTSPYFDNSTNNQSDENSQIGKNEENQQGNSGDNNDSNAVTQHEPLSSTLTSPPSNWRPLLLFVPLRLGLHNPNPCYFNAIKVCKS
ncbi:unnamed protein product [Trichobilharzia regenti]|nr:unnamed protein product [Trichobilharzia regenti]